MSKDRCYGFLEKTCKTCGKRIIYLSDKRWVFKRKRGTTVDFYCGYNCMRKAEMQEIKKKNG